MISLVTRLIIIIVLIAGCAVNESKTQTEPEHFPAIWLIRFIDAEEQSLGYLKLRLTDEFVDGNYCGNDYRKKAFVIEDELDVDVGMDKQPAYHLDGFWIKIDLTASVCYTNYMLIGGIDREEASGFFNYTHPLGGYNIGRFAANPVSE